ncbi:TPA: adenylyl-sulfate kinase [Candidatus Micrarchaeota archaeon]|nr:adenylyl-sulfate kinase [Candidatus Micrarchaeota archaeon]
MKKLMLIMVCGLPGTGKSHLSRELAKRLGAEYLNSDSIRNRTLEERTYSEEEKARIYSLMGEEASRLLKEGKDVIVDATFYLGRYRRMMKEAADGAGTRFFAILCVLGEDELRKRFEKRKGEKSESEADFDVYLKVKEIFEPMELERIELDMSLPEEEMLGRVLAYVGR